MQGVVLFYIAIVVCLFRLFMYCVDVYCWFCLFCSDVFCVFVIVLCIVVRWFLCCICYCSFVVEFVEFSIFVAIAFLFTVEFIACIVFLCVCEYFWSLYCYCCIALFALMCVLCSYYFD